MDFDRFCVLVSAPHRTRQELLTILDNVRGKASKEYEATVLDVLNQRFPEWMKKSSSQRGRSDCVAKFSSESRRFDSARAGYLWIVERFFALRPQLLQEPSCKNEYFSQGRDRYYFARTPKQLFPRSPNLAEESANYARLSMGWYANTNLSNEQKFEILTRVSVRVGLQFKRDWDWQVNPATPELKQRQQDVEESQILLDELLSTMGVSASRYAARTSAMVGLVSSGAHS